MSAVEVIKCPNCGSWHEKEDGRFCNKCGLSVEPLAVPEKKSSSAGDQNGEGEKVRCAFCGVLGTPPVCAQCGNELTSPE